MLTDNHDLTEAALEDALVQIRLLTDQAKSKIVDDGVALTSVAHPCPRGWRRVISWLRCLRGLRSSSIETVEIEVREVPAPPASEKE